MSNVGNKLIITIFSVILFGAQTLVYGEEKAVPVTVSEEEILKQKTNFDEKFNQLASKKQCQQLIAFTESAIKEKPSIMVHAYRSLYELDGGCLSKSQKSKYEVLAASQDNKESAEVAFDLARSSMDKNCSKTLFWLEKAAEQDVQYKNVLANLYHSSPSYGVEGDGEVSVWSGEDRCVVKKNYAKARSLYSDYFKFKNPNNKCDIKYFNESMMKNDNYSESQKLILIGKNNVDELHDLLDIVRNIGAGLKPHDNSEDFSSVWMDVSLDIGYAKNVANDAYQFALLLKGEEQKCYINIAKINGSIAAKLFNIKKSSNKFSDEYLDGLTEILNRQDYSYDSDAKAIHEAKTLLESAKKKIAQQQKERTRLVKEDEVRQRRDYPYTAMISCGFQGQNFPVMACFEKTELKVSYNNRSVIYGAYDFATGRIGRDSQGVLNINLPKHFRVIAQNSQSSLILTVKILDSKGAVVFEDQASQWGVVNIGN